MFIKNNDNGLVFIKSKNINAFPCARRRSNLIDTDGNDDTVSDRYYIPFDPEARLNTEANNRRHSGLNGFKQNYLLNWVSESGTGSLSLVLAGYLFNIKLDYGYTTPDAFGALLESGNYLGTSDSIYATIKLAKVKFFSGTTTVPEAATEILRDQVLNDEPATCLDFLVNGADKERADSYYFSGLSFSSEDLNNPETGIISLQILAKDSTGWHIHNPSKLPNIDHGDTIDSIKINGDLSICSSKHNKGNLTVEGNLEVNEISAAGVDAGQLKQNGHTAALLDIIPIPQEDGKVCYQLKFTGAVEATLEN